MKLIVSKSNGGARSVILPAFRFAPLRYAPRGYTPGGQNDGLRQVNERNTLNQIDIYFKNQ